MKKTSLSILILGLLTVAGQAGTKMDKALAEKFKSWLDGKNHGVVMTPQLPSTAKKGDQLIPETLTLVIADDGQWKFKALLGVRATADTTATLPAGERVKITLCQVVKTGLNLEFDTLREIAFPPDSASPLYDIHSNRLEFRFSDEHLAADTPENLTHLCRVVSGFVRLFPAPEAAEAFIAAGLKDAPQGSVSLGMTPAEVESLLGPAQKQVDLGSKQVRFYEQWIVTFIDGKVREFKAKTE